MKPLPLTGALGSGILILAWACGPSAAEVQAQDYFKPELLRGSIYQPVSSNLLFRSVRTAARVGDEVRVIQDYTNPAGQPAARERFVYHDGQLISYELDEWQIDARGRAVIEQDPDGRPVRIQFEYTVGHGEKARTRTGRERYRGEVLVNDMIPGFLQTHWDELMAGRELKVRYIVVTRRETVGFTLSKVRQTSWRSQPVVEIRMAASNFLVSALVDPLVFLVEQDGEHRILAYTGRTVVKTRRGDDWVDLDALSVFEWP